MATRVIRNDFVAGEISPALWGREDQELYYHGAARLENFVPMKTGGIRKRAGTELVWHLSKEAATEYRVIPYLYDRDAWGLLALYRAVGESAVKCRFLAHRADGTEQTTDETAVSQISLTYGESLSGIRYQQIGDTLFLTLHGHRAVMCRVTFAAPTLEWSQVVSNEKPAQAPELSAKAYNFHPAGSEGYVEGFRKFRLWGVRNGVLSEPYDTRVSITLKWISGAYIEVTFTPNWGQHDYYILAKLLGGQYGEVARFYPDRTAGAKSDANWTAATLSQSETIDGTTYTAAGPTTGVDPKALWRTTDPDDLSGGIHKCGTFCSSLTGTYTKSTSSPVLSLLVWFGAKMNDGGGNVVDVGLASQVVARLRKGGDSGSVIAEWTITPQYGDSSQTLMVESPVAAPSGQYSLTFHDPSTDEAVAVPMRGIVLCSDTSTLMFHDDNISPGSIAGQQDPILVGDTGMDVDIISTWQQRLVAASSQTHPFTMWFSTIGDLYNFYTYRPQNADDAFEATLAVTRASRILHLATEKLFLVFTESGEFTVDSSGGAFSFNTINVRKCSGIGAHPDVPPTITEGDILFVANDARSLYQMRYRLDEDSVRPTCLSHRAAHLTETHRIRAMAYQAHPDSVLWCLLDDGSLASLTFVPDEQVVAWARHSLSGGGGLVASDIFATGSLRADVETDTTGDMFIVFRDADSPGDVWVERMRPCVVADAPETSAARCADHMGYEAADYPTGGDPEAAVEASMETLRMDRGDNAMAAQTNSFDSVLRIRRSGAVSVRPAGAGDRMAWSGTATQPDALPREDDGRVQLVRRDVRVSPRAFQNKDNRLEIKSSDEWPCEILALEAAVHFGDVRRT